MERNLFRFEVCANGVESCLAAQAGGADRVELCAGIPEGGTTPSYGEIMVARRVLTTTRLHVIIRPRGGDFLYTPLELERMEADIEVAGPPASPHPATRTPWRPPSSGRANWGPTA